MSATKTAAGIEIEELDEASSLEVPVETIPLPPQALWAELDNAEGGPAPAGSQAPKPAAAGPAPEVATLRFVGERRPFERIVLDYPFELDGARIEAVNVRQLRTLEMGGIVRDMQGSGTLDLYEVYSAMTGLPAPVLRALPAIDGEKVTGAAYDFLPQLLKMASG